MKIVVTGGRDFKDKDFVKKVLFSLWPTAVSVGDCPTGVDLFVRELYNARVFEARWTELGRKAGPIRNGEMLRACRQYIVIAFPGGAGTADCVRQAKMMSMTVLEAKP